jgi:hypothetical protein
MYGSYMEPAYNILTYTWGRWQLRESPSLAIKGVSWKVPAVDEAHFTVDGLSRVIQRVSRGVSFVWIDVACIDHENRAAMMEEVGKQAGIFQRADQVFVWLSHHSTSALQDCVDSLHNAAQTVDDFAGSRFENKDEIEYRIPWLQSTSDLLEILFGDPWFSSL